MILAMRMSTSELSAGLLINNRKTVKGFIGRIALWDTCKDILTPLSQLDMQVFGYVRQLLSQIFFFADIVLEVVEFDAIVFEELNEFVVTFTDGGTGRAALIAVVRVMPENRAAIITLIALENRQDTLAIAVLLRLCRSGV